ncbi:MAG: hypothetical protein Hals2KO_26470 [Halioglobus sp.]
MSLLNTLGYNSDKTIDIPKSDPLAFLELLAEYSPDIELNLEKALFDDWLRADILFQLTDEELSQDASLFKDDKVNSSMLQSYLFFAIELNQRDYARGKLTAIARQLNRVFPMPVMVFIKHRDLLSIAVINRRLNKRDAEKDVLGKVTIIRDISLANPHRGHLDILQSFALPSLVERTAIHSFDTLHAAWEEIFNVELLNERFYKDLFKWYFWALPEVRFPDDMKPKELSEDQEADYYEKLRATGLIRLLTRLIFCWFLKEKGLIPDTLFDKQALAGMLNNLDDDKPTYHQAILQNLFFATLNQRMNARGELYRVFAKDEGFLKNRDTYGVDNLYRYESLFKDPDAALKEFEDIPFLNGGLFECLDRTDDNGKKIYVDGFSRNNKKRPNIPNQFFFGEGEVNIGAVTGERRRGTEKVRGLIQILSNYKFTIVENTPIDQEIALDPELLGKVFENLLASYNDETKTTARKQTGSFYTPRPIVEYMADESLKAHLATVLGRAHDMAEEDARTGLDILFAYTEKQHPFEANEVDTLIGAIDSCKILDPACGSGAFPMGVLHKLVYILTKLDPDNARWKRTQLDKLDSVSMREELERTFENNNDDYGRKLYLIENCLYGVDIQPIAIQLSKLRFFISLICDQKTNRNKAQNHGVRPLPNLETKFVAANTLIGLGEDAQLELFKSPRVVKIEEELQKVRHDYFSVQKRQRKLALQRKDNELRRGLANELIQSSFADQETSGKLASWNPYDSQMVADYFEPLWMYDHSVKDGFNVILGNPPYLKERDNKRVFNPIKETRWGEKYHRGKMDYWYFFLHRAFELGSQEGIIAFITSRYWINSSGSKNLIKHIRENSYLFHVVDIGKLSVFDEVAGHHMLHFYKIGVKQGSCMVKALKGTVESIDLGEDDDLVDISIQEGESLFTPTDEIKLYSDPFEIEADHCLGDFYEVTQGVVQNPDKVSGVMARRYGLEQGKGVFVLSDEEVAELQLNDKEKKYVRKFYDEAMIQNFHLETGTNKRLLYLTKSNCPSLSGMPHIKKHLQRYKKIMDGRRETVKGSIEWFQMHWPRDPKYFESEKVVIPSMFVYPKAAYVEQPSYFGLGSNVIIGGRESYNLKCLAALLNSSVACWWFYRNGKKRGAGVDIGVERLRGFPLPAISKAQNRIITALVDLFRFSVSKNLGIDEGVVSFMQEVIDACVMECYFHAHMKDRNLLLLGDVGALVDDFDPEAGEAERLEFLKNFYQTANSPTHPVRNRLLRMTADSPDLLAVIKEDAVV